MGKKIRVELKANQSLSIEYPVTDGGEPMFAKLYLWYRSSGMFKKVSAGGFKVLGYLLMCADFEEHDCYPSLATIGRETGLSKPTVVKAIGELGEMGMIVKHNRFADCDHGAVSNYYTITQPPRAVPGGVVKNIDRGVKMVDRGGKDGDRGVVKNVDSNKTQENKSHLTRLLKQKKNIKGFCVGGEEVNMGGMIEMSGDTVAEIEAMLGRIGFRTGVNRYARELVDNGLTLENVGDAARIACYKVAKGETRVSKELGGVIGQGGWTPQLRQESLRYMRGVIRTCIDKGIPVKVPEQMKADLGEESEWMNTVVCR